MVTYFGLASPFLIAAGCFAAVTCALSLVRVRAAESPPPARMGRSLRAAISDHNTIAAAAAIVIAGGTTGVSALLVPDRLHAAGASAAQIGVAFAVSGVLFVAGSALTASAGSRAIRIPVILAGMLALALAFTPAVLASAPFAIIVMLCATTTARSVLWTVSYPLAALGAERSEAGLGVVMGMLNGAWAATVLLGPVAAGLAAESFNAQAVFALTAVACVAIFAVTILALAGSRRGGPAGRRVQVTGSPRGGPPRSRVRRAGTAGRSPRPCAPRPAGRRR
jgi:predicted MFS family arabinose efflux permease